MVRGKIYFSKKVISLATHTEKMLSDNQLKLLFHVMLNSQNPLTEQFRGKLVKKGRPVKLT